MIYRYALIYIQVLCALFFLNGFAMLWILEMGTETMFSKVGDRKAMFVIPAPLFFAVWHFQNT